VLLEASRTAPSFGVNGRELVLRAAAKAAAQAPAQLPAARGTAPSGHLGTQEVGGGEGGAAVGADAAQALCEAVPARERPSVAYINRAATPRVSRQARAAPRGRPPAWGAMLESAHAGQHRPARSPAVPDLRPRAGQAALARHRGTFACSERCQRRCRLSLPAALRAAAVGGSALAAAARALGGRRSGSCARARAGAGQPADGRAAGGVPGGRGRGGRAGGRGGRRAAPVGALPCRRARAGAGRLPSSGRPGGLRARGRRRARLRLLPAARAGPGRPTRAGGRPRRAPGRGRRGRRGGREGSPAGRRGSGRGRLRRGRAWSCKGGAGVRRRAAQEAAQGCARAAGRRGAAAGRARRRRARAACRGRAAGRGHRLGRCGRPGRWLCLWLQRGRLRRPSGCSSGAVR